MKAKIKQLLLPFYFGSIEESDRLTVERELLVDSEVLVDFLDLKRSLEAAQSVPHGPSVGLWAKLSQQPNFKKKTIWTLSFGAGLAATAALVFIFYSKIPTTIVPETNRTHGPEILFDSSSELPASSNVL